MNLLSERIFKTREKIESIVRHWSVLSMLAGRYSGSAESAVDYDIKRFTEQDPETWLPDRLERMRMVSESASYTRT